MGIDLAQWLVAVAAVYATLGLMFALAFVSRGLQRIDPGAGGTPWGARLLAIPGAAALWPLLAWKWCTQTAPPVA